MDLVSNLTSGYYVGHVGYIRFSSAKNCFLTIPEKWVKDLMLDDLKVFQVIYGESQEKIYVSCVKDRIHQNDLDSKVFINEKFAEKLGIKNKDLVIMQPILKSSPKAVTVTLEPLTIDDWEIMESASEYITDNLMNQIRVVSTGLVFPFWIESYCFYAKVVACEPDHNPVILCANSEVRILPKDRYAANSLKERRKCNYLQFNFLRNTQKAEHTAEGISDSDENTESLLNEEINLTKSIAALAPTFLSSWFSSPKEGTSVEDSSFYFNDIFDFGFNSVLRVLPCTNYVINLPTSVQATTVFISASTFVACCGDTEIPPCFVALLEKFQLPEKKRRHMTDNGTKFSNYLSSKESESNIKDGTNGKGNSIDSKGDSINEQRPFNSVYVTVIVVKSAEEDEFSLPTSLFTYRNAIAVPKELKRALTLEVACLVNLKSVCTKPLSSYKLVFHPVAFLSSDITEQTIHEHFISWAFGIHRKRKQNTYVISDGTLVKLKFHSRKHEFFIHLDANDASSKGSHSSPQNSFDLSKSSSFKDCSDYTFITYKILKKACIKIGSVMCSTIYDERPYLLKDSGIYCEIKAPKLSKLGGVKDLSIKAIEDIEFWLKLKPLSYISNHSSTYSGCILICGPKGVGKSSFANALCKKFSSNPYYVLVRNVQCIPLKGKRVDTIAKKWDDIVSEAIYGQPSLILLEDLDCLASAPVSHEQENGPEGIYFASVSQAFVSMMNRIISSESNIVVIATAQSLHSLHPSLVNTKGRHIFQSILEVNPPNTEQRIEILYLMLCSKPHISLSTPHELNINKIAAKTEGYVAQDLSVLVDRAIHAAWTRLATSDENSQMSLKNEDFDVALRGLVPSSLRGVSLQIQDQRTWKDVGGLSSVKKIIQQIIMWPTKYKELYKNYSLKPQTNILLYGAPGTGKTLLAGVVAHECGLNFISVKGPELLSKYIGASEQAVRDLFKRATTARPCILFFDEFDSIAPRRGHDSTGVTDRVVNQLLTQLDGVESLEGVHVIAATNRPELIDPALLRPGRLDKCLLCPMPDKVIFSFLSQLEAAERIEILHCLSSKLPLCDDVDFDSIASLTVNFSGADLQALLYSAHIAALHEVLNSSSKRYSSSEDSDYCIASDKHLFIPSLEIGSKVPSYEEGKKILHEVAIVHDNYFGSRKAESRRHSTLTVSVTQRHLLKTASEMKPSVSTEERLRYELIFKDFQNVLAGESSALPKNVKRVTLA